MAYWPHVGQRLDPVCGSRDQWHMAVWAFSLPHAVYFCAASSRQPPQPFLLCQGLLSCPTTATWGNPSTLVMEIISNWWQWEAKVVAGALYKASMACGSSLVTNGHLLFLKVAAPLCERLVLTITVFYCFSYKRYFYNKPNITLKCTLKKIKPLSFSSRRKDIY